MIERIPGKRLPKTFPVDVIENVKTRTLMVLQSQQKDSYTATKENQDKMKGKFYVLGNGKAFKEFPYLQTSLYTRALAAEVMFGDP